MLHSFWEKIIELKSNLNWKTSVIPNMIEKWKQKINSHNSIQHLIVQKPNMVKQIIKNSKQKKKAIEISNQTKIKTIKSINQIQFKSKSIKSINDLSSQSFFFFFKHEKKTKNKKINSLEKVTFICHLRMCLVFLMRIQNSNKKIINKSNQLNILLFKITFAILFPISN